jgi:serine protease Do
MSSLTRLAVLILLVWSAPAPGRELPDFTQLVRRQAPVVVNISTTQRLKSAVNGQERGEAVPDPFLPSPGEPESGEGGTSLGSGLILSPDGQILTCAHVVEDAREIVVRLYDRREFNARVLGLDRRTDIALLKIDAESLPRAVVGDPKKLQVGEWVLAIGSPFGFASSATAGIVSAKGRSLPRENYVPFLQTDVAINPGNSGGPLFNLRGEVVGVNSRIYSVTSGFTGLSFAIPIDVAIEVADQLRTRGIVRRGWLGISLQEVSRELARAYGLPRAQGALIADILPGGPAARSELQIGDIVLEYQGQPIERSTELAPRVGATEPGARAVFKVFRRGGGVQAASAVIGELREEHAARAPAEKPKITGTTAAARLGLALSDLTPRQRERRDFAHGVNVEGVEEGLGREAGLLPGDVILEIEGKRLYSVPDFNRLALHAPRDRPAVVRIRRGAQALFLAMRLGE